MIGRKGVEPIGPDSPVLQLNGVPTRFADGLAGDCFLQTSDGSWRPLEDDGLYAVEAECVALYDDLAASIFGGLGIYRKLLPHVPPFLSQAGLNSEAPIRRDAFETALVKLAAFPELNRFLYLYDCQVLVSAIQECTKEVSQLTGEFYRILNLEPFFTPGIPVEDSIRWSTSPTVTMLFSTLGFLFIRMHSLLDYLAKLACESESIRKDFKTYPRLASSNFMFGDRKKLKKLAREKVVGTLFETCDEVTEVELIRNLLIHDGLLDDMPKGYEVIEDGIVIERFVLMPDRRDGKFERFKNRHRFYGGEDKINLRLTALVRGFQTRQVGTLRAVRSLFAQR
ncbi:hypothetical protein HRJ34_15135 [Rhizorhabdus wittichii]|uniref:Uncharacterized protein n=1 Tax=Rhizorhabdus wittichii TaxID=160791 RepID=A0A975CYM3_9SPHN|nr:hypothetical protein [Rhizorhabdus wittichii]QTH19704.1 hypothetical protein HRJ34_15135 [Rhizorhabdus wittichii]